MRLRLGVIVCMALGLTHSSVAEPTGAALVDRAPAGPSINWKLSVWATDLEIHSYMFNETGAAVPVAASSWSCKYGPLEKKIISATTHTESTTIMCWSGKVAVATTVTCNSLPAYQAPGNLTVRHGDKSDTIILACTVIGK